MRADLRRVAVILALTACAVALPCGAWYVVGSRAVAQEAEEILEAPRAQAQETAKRLARRLGSRLEAVRKAESGRPYQHYMHQYHDPDETCECPVYRTSPLAAGRVDPLILAHFQIDGSGRLSLPTLGEQVEEPDPGWIERQQATLDLLTPATTNLIAAIRPAGGSMDAVTHPNQLARVTPLRWRTIELAGEPILAALREVIASEGFLVQGLVVAPSALEDYLGAAAFPVRLLPGTPGGAGEAALPLAGAAWRLTVDASDAITDAGTRAAEARSRFVRIFSLGTSAAFVAGLCVIGLVWQTERLARARARFASAAAHELRSPLAGIRLYGEMMADDLGKPGKTKEYARRMAGEAEQLGRVVTNVLGYSRLERGALPVHLEVGDLGAVVEQAVDRLRPSVETAGARVEVTIAEPLPRLRFDGDAVYHIVQNLVDNAEKFSRDAADRTIHLELAADRDGVVLSVTDHGPGIPRRMRRRTPRSFASGSGKNPGAGLGLGLVLVHALVDAHGGSIRCDEISGGGSVFRVVFPV